MTGTTGNQDKSTCGQVPDGSPKGNTSFKDRGPVTGTGCSDTYVDMWRGQVQNFRKAIKKSTDFRPSWQG